MEITKERFFEMLEILPPESWIRGVNWEMFQVGEPSDYNDKGARYATFLRIGENYWELGDQNKLREIRNATPEEADQADRDRQY